MSLVPLVLALLLQAAQEPAPPAEEKVQDRWRVPFPDYPLNEPGGGIDPYRQNVLKGDYPILGQNTFLILGARSDTTLEARRLPTPSGTSTRHAGDADFFGRGDQLFADQRLSATLELYRGETAFRPRDWELRVTGVADYNYLDVAEHTIVNPNVKEEETRTDHWIALQEALAELHLFDVSDDYDFVSVRAGIQPFLSDFRGFLFSDTNLGARLFGTLASNRIQWNLAVFDQLEKDTNSDLNTRRMRDQNVWIANLYVQDFIWLGYTAQVSVHFSQDEGGTEYDENGNLVRPAVIGTLRPHEVNAVYYGWAGDGHIGPLNLTHAFYVATGTDEFNPLAGKETDIEAYFAALELSTDIDWIRLRTSAMWASGDRDPTDGTATGFDSILDAPEFAGGFFSFWGRQSLRFQGVNLVQRNSFLPDLRSSKTQGQVNFVNPGILLVNAGADLEILPELKAVLNLNYMRFDRTESLEYFAFQRDISRNIGLDASLGLVTRPMLNNNLVVTVGGAAFFPQGGFKDLYEEDHALYSAFVQLTLLY